MGQYGSNGNGDHLILQHEAQKNIAYDVNNAGDNDVVKRPCTVALGADDRGTEVINHHHRSAQHIDLHVQDS